LANTRSQRLGKSNKLLLSRSNTELDIPDHHSFQFSHSVPDPHGVSRVFAGDITDTKSDVLAGAIGMVFANAKPVLYILSIAQVLFQWVARTNNSHAMRTCRVSWLESHELAISSAERRCV